MTSFRFLSVPRRTQRRPPKENLILRKQVQYFDAQGEGEGESSSAFLGPGANYVAVPGYGAQKRLLR